MLTSVSDFYSSYIPYLLFRFFFFFFNDTATTEIYTLSLHDALPISPWTFWNWAGWYAWGSPPAQHQAPCSCGRYFYVHLGRRSEEHTSELQSLTNLVCRLLLEKKKKTVS